MLKLKKLQILGFKSFCDRTELKFQGEGVAGIIGPNGCGKSNISDAITWVLGEQSAKTLRGSRMEDVIFAGTRDRKPNGMAEVSLTLIDPERTREQTSREPEIEIVDEMPETTGTKPACAPRPSTKPTSTPKKRARTDRDRGRSKGVARLQSAERQTPSSRGSTRSEAPKLRPPKRTACHSAVVLKIRRRKFNRNNFKKGEIVVTRRLFRSGESEYLLNGKLCRLRDIQDIFMGTGLGPESYAIIEQGRIGQILSSKPHDRRAIIEEAAGITKFKTKKRLAEAAPRRSQAEPGPRQRHLRRSHAADEFAEAPGRQGRALRQAARRDARQAARRARQQVDAHCKPSALTLEDQLTQLAEEIRSQAEAVQVLEAEARRAHAARLRHRDRSARDARTPRNDHPRNGSRHARAEDQRRTLRRTRARVAASAAERDRRPPIERRGALAAGSASPIARLSKPQHADVAAAQQEAQARTAAGSARGRRELQQVEREQEQRRVAVMQAVADEAAACATRWRKATEQIAGHDREAARLAAELAAANSQIEAFGGQRGQIAPRVRSRRPSG